MRATPSWMLVCAIAVACDCEPEPRGRSETAVQRTEARAAEEQRPARAASGEPEEVRFETEDGVTIVGTLRPGGEPGAPAVVLAHQLGSNRSEFAPLVERLARPPGLTVLAIDLRGHGDSTQGPGGATLDHGAFETADFEAMANDVRAAVTFLEQRAGLEPRRIGVLGSSIGASAAIRAAADDDRIDAIVALSPGRAYRGVDAITPVVRIGRRPLLAVAAEEEFHAAEAARDITRIAPAGEFVTYPGSAHGMAMAAGAPEMLERVDRFLRQHLGAGGAD